MKHKNFDCVEMKRAAQERICAQVEGMTPEEEIACFREGGAEFQEAIESAKRQPKDSAASRGGKPRRNRRVVSTH